MRRFFTFSRIAGFIALAAAGTCGTATAESNRDQGTAACPQQFTTTLAMAPDYGSSPIVTGAAPPTPPTAMAAHLAVARMQLAAGLNRAALQSLRDATASLPVSSAPLDDDSVDALALLSLAESAFGTWAAFDRAANVVATELARPGARQSPQSMSTMINLGAAFFQAGDAARAVQWFDRAAATAAATNGSPANQTLRGKALVNAALAAARLGQGDTLDRALAARTVVDSRPPSPDRDALLASLARLLAQLPMTPANSEEQLRAGHALASSVVAGAVARRDQHLLADALGTLGEIYYRGGQWDEAANILGRAATVARGLPEDEQLYRWFWLKGRVALQQGKRAAALEDFELAARALADIRRKRALAPSIIGGADAGVQVSYDFADLLFKRAGEETDEATRRDLLSRGRDVIEASRVSEIEDLFRDPCISSHAAQRRMIDAIDPSVAVIYPVFFGDRLVILLAHGRQFEQVVVPVTRARMYEETQRFRALLEKRTTRQYLRSATQLHAWLIAPIESRLRTWQVNTLVFVPDGILRTIPLAALHDGERFLIERYALAVTPGISLTDPKSLAAKPLHAVLSGMSVESQGFAALPSVDEELDQIGKLMNATTFRNAEFSLARLEKVLAQSNTNLVHIASHGQFSANPAETFLLAFDGKLTIERLRDAVAAGRIREEPLELLTLSACQTAAGDERAALGLAGVAVRAGARSALASLWFVNDESTSQLIVGFYQQLAKTGTSKADAMRMAQRAMLQDERFSHPAYWAPFLIIGNWL